MITMGSKTDISSHVPWHLLVKTIPNFSHAYWWLLSRGIIVVHVLSRGIIVVPHGPSKLGLEPVTLSTGAHPIGTSTSQLSQLWFLFSFFLTFFFYLVLFSFFLWTSLSINRYKIGSWCVKHVLVSFSIYPFHICYICLTLTYL